MNVAHPRLVQAFSASDRPLTSRRHQPHLWKHLPVCWLEELTHQEGDLSSSDWSRIGKYAGVSPAVVQFGPFDPDGGVSQIQSFWKMSDSSSEPGVLARHAAPISSAPVVDEDFHVLVLLPVEQLVPDAAGGGAVQHDLAAFLHLHLHGRRLWGGGGQTATSLSHLHT